MSIDSLRSAWSSLSAQQTYALRQDPATSDTVSDTSDAAPVEASSAMEDGQASVSISEMSPAEQAESTTLIPQDADFAVIGQHVYGDGDVALPPGWEHVDTPDELDALGVSPDEVAAMGLEWENGFLVDPETGLQAGVYQHEDGTITLAFAGTDPGDISGDGLTNFDQAAFDVPPAYQTAIDLSITLDQGLTETGRDDALVITGHSMGGGLAVAGGYATGAVAVSFNAAGLRDGTIDYALDQRRERLGEDPGEDQAREDARNGRVRHIYIDGDPLTTVQDASLFSPEGIYTVLRLARLGPILGSLAVSGAVVVLTLPAADDGSSIEVDPPEGTGVLDAHSISTVVAGIRSALPPQTAGTDPLTGAPVIATGDPSAFNAYGATSADPAAMATILAADPSFENGDGTTIVVFTQDADGEAGSAYYEKTGTLPPDLVGVSSITTASRLDGTVSVQTQRNEGGVLVPVQTATVSDELIAVEPGAEAAGLGAISWPGEATLTVVRGGDGQPVSAELTLQLDGTTLRISYVYVDGVAVIASSAYTFVPDEHEAKQLNLLYYGTETPAEGGFVAGQSYTIVLDPAQADALLADMQSLEDDHPRMTHLLRGEAGQPLTADSTGFRIQLAHLIANGALFEALRVVYGDGQAGGPITILDAEGNEMPKPSP